MNWPNVYFSAMLWNNLSELEKQSLILYENKLKELNHFIFIQISGNQANSQLKKPGHGIRLVSTCTVTPVLRGQPVLRGHLRDKEKVVF